MPTTEERLRRFAEELDDRAPAVTLDRIVQLTAAPRRSRLVPAMVVAVAALGAIGAALLATDDVESVRSNAPTTTAATETTVTGPPPPATIPTEPPAGWQDVEYGGLRLFAPPDWTVSSSPCHGTARSVTLGAASESARCRAPSTTAPWVWIAPEEDVADRASDCVPGFVNNLPGCQRMEGFVETWFVEGLDVVLISSPGADMEETYSRMTFSWQYADRERAAETTPDTYVLSQPLSVAGDFAVAIASGDCTRAAELSVAEFQPACETSPSTDTVRRRGASMTGPGGAVQTTSAQIELEDGRVFSIDLRHEWSIARSRGEWRVTAYTTAP